MYSSEFAGKKSRKLDDQNQEEMEKLKTFNKALKKWFPE